MRLTHLASIRAFHSDQEIDELQAAVDERREARLRCLWEAEEETSGSALLVPETEVFHGTS
jgi:hypothetical protein